MNYTRKVLNNGLRIITVPMSAFESATVLVMVGAGSRYETRQNNGISHFLEHMAFKGTKKRPSAMLISGIIDGIGGEFNAFTGKETTGYYIKAQVAHVELCLDLLSDMLRHSLFQTQEINKEKGVIIEEMNMYEDTPARKLGDIYDSLLYGDSPMGWDIVGTKEVIHKVKREDFTMYMQTLYSPDNITVVVSGGIDANRIENLVEKYFGNMPRFATIKAQRVDDEQKNPGFLLKKKQTEQVHFSIGFRTVPLDHEDRYALDVLASILGGGMSSRLFHEIREKRGLAYYVRSTSDNYVDCGTLVSSAGVDPKRADEAMKVMLDQLMCSTQTGNINQEELKKAKEYMKGHFVLELEDSRSVAAFYSHQEILESHILTPEQIIKKIDEISLDDVSRVAHKYIINQTLNMAIIGNFDDGQKFEKLLKL